RWFSIYADGYVLRYVVPAWYYGLVGLAGLRQIEREEHCRFVHLERVLRKLSPRPLLMIHGGADTYIKPEMANSLYSRVREPKELWLVEGAKHNQALQVASDEYRRRVLEFFQRHLGNGGDPR